MTTQNLTLALVHNGLVSQPLTLPDDGGTVHIRAVTGNRYLIADPGATNNGPKMLVAKRAGNALTLGLPDADAPLLIIDDYYLHPGDVIGTAEDGSVHAYVSESDDDSDAAALADGDAAFIIPDAAATDGFAPLLASDTSYGALAALAAFAGLLALGGIAYSFQNQHGGSSGKAPIPPPEIISAEDSAGSITGVIASGGATDHAAPLLSGTGGTPGHVIEIFDHGVSIGSTLVAADGAWQFTPDRLAHGTHSFTTTETSPDGRVSPHSPAFILEVDLVAPARPLLTLTDDAAPHLGPLAGGDVTNDSRPLLSGSAEPGARVEIFIDGVKAGETAADDDGSWRFTLTAALSDGEHSFTAVATDAVGNKGLPSVPLVITVDTAIDTPLITAVSDAVDGGVTGAITSDGTGLTNDARPVITGTAEKGSLVTIYSGDTPLGSVLADAATGEWTWQYPEGQRLDEGEHRLTVVATDPAGNVSVPSEPFTVTVDTETDRPLIASVTDAVDGGVTGAIADDGTGLTNDARPLLTGTAEKGSLVMIYSGDTQLGSVYADAATGEWTWQYPEGQRLDEGEHRLTVVATDPAGNVSVPSEPFSITVDTETDRPAIASVTDAVAGGVTGAITSDGTGLTNDARPVIAGTAEKGSLVTVYSGTTPLGSVYADAATGAWSWQYGSGAAQRFTDGEHVLTVRATDPAGNPSAASASFVINVDTQTDRPAIASVTDAVAGGVTGAITNDGTGLTNDARPVIAGTAEKGSLVTVYSGTTPLGSVYADAATGAWSWQYGSGAAQRFTDGEHVLTVRATDPAGNPSAASASFVINVDTETDRPAIASVTDAVAGGVTGAITNDGTGLTNDARPVIAGTAEKGSLVTVYSGTTPLGSVYADAATGAWSWQYGSGATERFTDGEHVLTVRATDPAGNVSADSASFVINVDTQTDRPAIASVTDAVAGGVTGALPADGTGLTNDARPVIAGTAEKGSLVTIYSGTTPLGSVYADAATGAWSWQYAAGERFTDDRHVLTVRATDPAGNVSADSASFVITVDTASATPAITSVTDAVAGGVTGAITNDGTGLTNDARPQLTGTADKGSLVTIYNGTTPLGSVYADAISGAWSWQHPAGERFTDNRHVLTVQAVSPAGTVSAPSDAFTLTVDTQTDRPAIASVTDAVAGGVTGAITNDGTGLTNDARPVIAGTAEKGSLVTVYSGTTPLGSVYADAATGAWSWQYGSGATERFTDGEHVLTVRATDPAGNPSAASASFVINVDTQTDRPAIASVTDAVAGGVTGAITNDGTGLTNDARPVIAGTAEKGSLVTIYSGTTPLGSVYAHATTGAWSWQYPAGERFTNGEHLLTVRATDPAGNVSAPSASFIVTVDTATPPSVANIQWDGETLTVQFDSTQYKVGQTLKLSIDGVEHKFTFDQDDLDAGSISFPWSSETEGNFDELTAIVISLAGNRSENLTLEKNSSILHQENFETQATLTFTNGQTFNFPGFDIKVLTAANGGFFRGIAGWEVPSPSMALTLMGGTKIELSLPNQDSDYIAFTAGDFNNTERFTVVFYDSRGFEVDRQTLTPGGGLIQEIKASVPFGVTFSKVTLELNMSGVWIDDIVMGKTHYSLGATTSSDVSSPSYNAMNFHEESYDELSLLLANAAESTTQGKSEATDMHQLLRISASDVLALNKEDLFLDNGIRQLMINGEAGDVVNLPELLPEGVGAEDWNQTDSVTLAGVNYQVLQHSGLAVELLVQQDVIINLNNH